MGAIIRIAQMFPLLIVLGAIAGVAYVIISGVKSPTRAKEILIRVFMVLSVALCVFFALATLYAILENNTNVLEFFASLLAIALIMLLITLVCRWRFKKNHPHYEKPTHHARTVSQAETKLRRVLRILQLLKRGPFDPRG